MSADGAVPIAPQAADAVRRCRRLAVLSVCALFTGLSAQAQPPARSFNIAAGPLGPALDAYLVQSGVQLIYKTDDIKGLSTKGVTGVLRADVALDRLLDGTALRVRRGGDGAMVIVPAAAPVSRRSFL